MGALLWITISRMHHRLANIYRRFLNNNRWKCTRNDWRLMKYPDIKCRNHRCACCHILYYDRWAPFNSSGDETIVFRHIGKCLGNLCSGPLRQRNITHQDISWVRQGVPCRSWGRISSTHAISSWGYFRGNIRSWVENECCCPHTVNISNVNFTTKHHQMFLLIQISILPFFHVSFFMGSLNPYNTLAIIVQGYPVQLW